MQGVTQGAYAIIICSPSGALAPSRCRCAVGRGRSGARASAEPPAGGRRRACVLAVRPGCSEFEFEIYTLSTSPRITDQSCRITLVLISQGTPYTLFMPG